MSKFRVASLVIAVIAALVAAPAIVAEDGSGTDGRYMVKFKDFRGASNAVRAAGGNPVIELEPQGVVAAYLPEQALRGLQNNPNVEYIEVDARRYLMGQTAPYGIAMVQANDPVFASNNSSGCTVCIIDSGYYRGHEDLQDNGVAGTNDAGSGLWYEDTCGHGTHVAGTIAALNNTVGVLGVNSNGSLNIWIEKVFDGSTCGWSYSSSLVTALNRCRSNTPAGQKLVVSMSLGGSTSSTTESNAFATAYNEGVLSIAAAGNDGTTGLSYPASYTSVISVAAVDAAGVVADFSQKNSAVEVAAPGVGILSTTPFKASVLKAGGNTYLGADIEGSARVDRSGALVDGGLCLAAGSWSGKVVLCQRGDISFADKVTAVKNGGGVAAVIYNNVPGPFAGTLNGTSTIPAISLSQEDGQAALAFLGTTATVENTTGIGNGYEAWDGTSMATPHVSGVAALVWSNFLDKSNAQIRAALQATAEDKGTTGKDNSYGYGIVKAKAAYDYLAGGVEPPPPPPPPPANISLAVTKVRVGKSNYAKLAWSGATTTNVSVTIDSTTTSTANDGTEQYGPMAKGLHSFKVCNSDASACSAVVTARF